LVAVALVAQANIVMAQKVEIHLYLVLDLPHFPVQVADNQWVEA
jgi:hypothetical protein